MFQVPLLLAVDSASTHQQTDPLGSSIKGGQAILLALRNSMYQRVYSKNSLPSPGGGIRGNFQSFVMTGTSDPWGDGRSHTNTPKHGPFELSVHANIQGIVTRLTPCARIGIGPRSDEKQDAERASGVCCGWRMSGPDSGIS